MSVVVLIGRILFALLFVLSSFGHFAQADGMATYAQAKGVPAAKAAVIGSGVLALVAGLMVVLGIWADLGCLLLLVFLIPTTFLMHTFWQESDPQIKQAEMINFNKNIALMGAALALFAFFAHERHLGLMITQPLFTLH
ncbi:DoxX family protein [Nocardia sp. alder85J]|uniref:DoxX family protein n=1 Tax=Nocardia sp. alder85J TaxID=2862949 RepID=UPI001CD3542E|nr:DoxX family protein [Nocardia sp. alder85J]MCX4095028.1 DoxX family protein [Nocardia sp. alder85J]